MKSSRDRGKDAVRDYPQQISLTPHLKHPVLMLGCFMDTITYCCYGANGVADRKEARIDLVHSESFLL